MTETLPAFVRAETMTFDPTAHQLARSVLLTFPTAHEQVKSNWCWAAVTSAIMVCRGHPEAALNQNAIVRRMFNDERNEAAPLFSCFSRFQISSDNDAHPELLETATQDQIVNHVLSGRPVAIHIQWNTGSAVGHAVCAFGVEQTGQGKALWIYDPSGKDSDDDNEKLIPISQMTRFEDGLETGTTGYWAAAYRITAP